MTSLEKFSLGLLCVLLTLALASYVPAIHGIHWFIRVAVPEMGIALLLLALPAALVVAKNSPKLSAALSSVLLIALLIPWGQALRVKSSLLKNWNFSVKEERDPLLLGERGAHSETTEEYKVGYQWDRYTPEGQAIKARILFVHGGSWRNGTRADYPQLLRYLADRGYEVVSPTYTLSRTAPYPAAVNDIQAAIDKLYQEDKIPLFLAGRSSGGHLALLASYRNPEKVKGVVGLYSPVDMKWSYDNPSNPNVLNSQDALEQFLSAPPEQALARYQEASPIFEVSEKGPPTLLIHGLADCLVYPRQSERLSDRLKILSVRHYVLFLPWAEHGGDVTVYGPTGRLSAWAIESFIDSIAGHDE